MPKAIVKPGTNKVFVKDETGNLASVDPAEIQQAYAQGFQLADEQTVRGRMLEKKYSSVGGLATSAGLATLRGATLGLSDPIITGIGGEGARQTLQEAKMANPGLSAGFEIGGSLAPLLLSGGASAAATGARGVGLLGRGARLVGAPTRLASRAGTAVERLAYQGVGRTLPGRVAAQTAETLVQRGMNAGLRALRMPGAVRGAAASQTAGKGYRTATKGLKMALGRGTWREAAARGISSGLGAAAEGALYGAGMSISDATLAGEDITVDKILAGARDAAVFGGLAGGVVGASSNALAKTLNPLRAGVVPRSAMYLGLGGSAGGLLGLLGVGALAKRMLQGQGRAGIRSLTKRMTRGLGPDSRAFVHELGKRSGQISDTLIHQGFDATAEHLANVTSRGIQNLATKTEKAGKRLIEDIRPISPDVFEYTMKTGKRAGKRILDDATTPIDVQRRIRAARTEMSAQLKGVYKQLDDAGAAPAVGAWLEDVSSISAKLAESGKAVSAKRLDKLIAGFKPTTLDDMVVAGRPVTFSELYSLRDKLAKLPRSADANLRRIGDTLDAHLQASARASLGDLGDAAGLGADQLSQLSSRYADTLSLERIVDQAQRTGTSALDVARGIKQGALGAARDASGAVVGAGRLLDEGKGLKAGMAAVASGHAGALAKLPKRAAESASRLIQAHGGHIAVKIASGVRAVDGYIDRSVRKLINPGPKVAARVMPTDFYGEGVLDAANADHSYLDEDAETSSELVDSLEDKRKAMRDHSEPYTERRRRFDQLQDDMAHLQDPTTRRDTIAIMTDEAADAYPQLAAATAQKLDGDIAYLSSLMPESRGSNGSSLQPLAAASRVPRHEVESFMRAADALADPLSVVDDLAKGKINREGIEALKVRRPALWAEIRDKISHAIAVQPDVLPFKKRVLLGHAFDFDADWSMQPENLSAIQATETQPPPRKGGKPGPKGKPSLDRGIAEQHSLQSGYATASPKGQSL